TPNYNQGQFIEETIRSVLLQGYPNLEYIVVDGNSSDQSIKLIEKYSPWFAGCVSAPDRGQSHAINTGLAWAHGEALACLKSDDLLQALVLRTIGIEFSENPACNFLAGHS